MDAVLFFGTAWAIFGLGAKGLDNDPLGTYFFNEQDWQHGSPFSTLGYHGHAGTILALLAIGWGVFAIDSNSRWRRRLALAALTVVLIAAAANASRVGLVLTAAGAAIMLLTSLRWQLGRRVEPGLACLRKLAFPASVALICVLCSAILTIELGSGAPAGTALGRFSTLLDEAGSTHSPRRMESRAAFRLIERAPLLGHGVGAYPAAVAADPVVFDHFFALPPEPGQTLSVIQHGAADVLEIPSDWGFLGGALLLLPVPVVMWRAAKAWVVGPGPEKRGPQDRRLLVVAGGLSTAVILVHGMVDVPLQSPLIRTLLALSVGLTLGISSPAPETERAA